ncbi:conserved hypothetical protein [Alteracholeplasma palmae J233]|uniref:Peptidase M50 domain-containing protein n=1 Tax=Alteracholeplasma palmae (strain ATCC 49389 / J233) TaxID=1318466 RepID=U4KKC8_ALTPJ|nr:site-2 protease family protein [Alteracholeplasma palmae]CCV63993.1 conserved hypothetical protein [Alteracholeplasma palmae J233]
MKKYQLPIFIIIMFVIGVIVGFLSYHGYLLKFFTALSNFQWYYIILCFLLGVFINIGAHELGHLIVLKKNGISIRAIFVLFLTVTKLKRWKIGIYPKLSILLGGMVIPNIPLIKTEEDYNHLITRFAKGIKAGPIASKFFCLFSIILFIFSMILNSSTFIAISFYLMILTIIITYLVLMASKVSYEGLYGDFVAYDKLTKDSRFALVYILQSAETSDYEKENKQFLWHKVVEQLNSTTEIYTQAGQELINFYLDEVVFYKKESIETVDERIKRVYQYLDIQKEEHFILAHMLMYFYYIKNYNESFFEVEKIINKFNSDKIERKVLIFWEERTKYLFNVTRDEAYKKRVYDAYKMNWILKPLKIESLIEIPLIKEVKPDEN